MEYDAFECISTESDLQEVKNAITEISNAKERIAGEQSLIKEIKKRMKDEFRIETKDLNTVVSLYMKQNRDQAEEKSQQPFDLFDKVFNKQEAV